MLFSNCTLPGATEFHKKDWLEIFKPFNVGKTANGLLWHSLFVIGTPGLEKNISV